MIGVLIIGLLLAIAIPGFIKAREHERGSDCRQKLKQMEMAKEQWAIDKRKGAFDEPSQRDLSPGFLRTWPNCPSGGTYTIGIMVDDPICSYGIGHNL